MMKTIMRLKSGASGCEFFWQRISKHCISCRFLLPICNNKTKEPENPPGVIRSDGVSHVSFYINSLQEFIRHLFIPHHTKVTVFFGLTSRELLGLSKTEIILSIFKLGSK